MAAWVLGGRDTAMAVALVRHLLDERRGSIYTVCSSIFIDLQKAHDSICSERTWEATQQHGIGGKVLDALYEDEVVVQVDRKRVVWYWSSGDSAAADDWNYNGQRPARRTRSEGSGLRGPTNDEVGNLSTPPRNKTTPVIRRHPQ